MATSNQLNTAWLDDLANPNHDGTTQQIDDFVQAFVTDNSIYNQKKAVVHQARLKEDEVWLKSLRDDVVPQLEKADKKQDSYISASHYIMKGHAMLPEGEPTQAEAKQCVQVFRDFNFRTNDSYGAESDKIIQMQQNLQAHQAFLTQIGAWTFFTKAVEQAQLVRQYLGQRAQTKGEFVKGEMKAARRATDQAIADLYKTIMAMMELMPSAELTALYTQLKGIELYARQYYISGGSGSGSFNQSGQSGQNNQSNSENSGNSENNGGEGTNTNPTNPTNNGDDDEIPSSGGGEVGGGGNQGGGTNNGDDDVIPGGDGGNTYGGTGEE